MGVFIHTFNIINAVVFLTHRTKRTIYLYMYWDHFIITSVYYAAGQLEYKM